MDSEFDELNESEFEEEDSQSYVVEEYDDRESSTRGLILVVVMILMTFLFMVFCPVDKVEKKRVKPAEPKVFKGPGIVGNTKYEVLNGKLVYKIGDKQTYSKAKLIVLKFTVENLSDVTKTFDSYMVGINDEGKRFYPAHSDFSMLIYEVKDKAYPLPIRVAAHAKKNVTLVFTVERAATKFQLVGRDFNAASTKSTSVAVPSMHDPNSQYETEPLSRYKFVR